MFIQNAVFSKLLLACEDDNTTEPTVLGLSYLISADIGKACLWKKNNNYRIHMISLVTMCLFLVITISINCYYQCTKCDLRNIKCVSILLV